MPFYEYQCSACNHHVEVLQKISDTPLRKCPDCGKQALQRLISAPVFRLKGGGWYETDFKSDKEEKRNIHGREEAAEAKGEDAKPADKDAAKPTDKDAAKPAESKAPAAKPDTARPESKRTMVAKPAAKPAKTKAAAKKPAAKKAKRR